jgi:S-adenosylmethionine-diacylglycerol 3-amino-3-carboxypropyl transferase
MNHAAETATNARYHRIRYAQCWEDADVLLQAMRVQPGDTCLSIASAGDNTLALAGAGAKRVIAVDLSAAQIACLELRIAAYRRLEYPEFLALVGQTEGHDRQLLYRRCRSLLTPASRAFWDSRRKLIRRGFAQVGRFEHFLCIFRRYLLPVVQGRKNVAKLFSLETVSERDDFYRRQWNNRRWRILCRIFFSRAFLGRYGRDPSFTRFADEPVWRSLERRIPEALVVQAPADNPYLQWILKGRFETALPWSWRESNYARIRNNLDAIEWRCEPLESVLADLPDATLNGCNLSDVFEYMSGTAYRKVLFELIRASSAGARLVYWNVVVTRSRPDIFASTLIPLKALAASLHQQDKAFFYRNLVIEEVA